MCRWHRHILASSLVIASILEVSTNLLQIRAWLVPHIWQENYSRLL